MKLKFALKNVILLCALIIPIINLEAQNEIKIIDRYIAIDNVCAWPNLTLMPDSTLIVTIFNQPTHGAWEGDIECWASTDRGKTWKYSGTPARHDPGTNRMNIAAGLAYNDDLIVISSGWSSKAPPGKPVPTGQGQILEPWISRSSDNGKTWVVSRSSVKKPPYIDQQLVPHGNIVKISENRLAAPFYARLSANQRDRRRFSFILISNDNGNTWGDEVIKLTDCGEPFLLPLSNKRWLGVARSYRDASIDSVVCLGEYLRYFISTDQGKSWKEKYHLTGAAQHPGHLLRMNDGRILLTYGNRRPPTPSIQILLSDNEGETWNFHARDLVSLEGAVIRSWGYGDMGYPSTVQLADGTLVTAYYSWGIESHNRYHMGVVRWKLQ